MSQAIKDFVRGMGQALDLGGTMITRENNSSQRDDLSQLNSDWQKVGKDIETAIHNVQSDYSSRQQNHG